MERGDAGEEGEGELAVLEKNKNPTLRMWGILLATPRGARARVRSMPTGGLA